ncbi:MAG: DNA-binding protein [Nanoarchaeota archaeon]
MQRQAEQENQTQQQIAGLENVATKYLDKDAHVRYGTIKAADADKAQQIVLVIAQLIQAGRITQPLTDTQFKALLNQITPNKREIRITRK